MKHRFLILFLASAILAGCSKNDTPAPPVQSSDYLVATVLEGNNFKLLKFNADGTGGTTIITSRVDVGNEFAVPAISPKGNKVVYFEGGIMKLLDVKADSRIVVLNQVNAFYGPPAFNADASRIVFSSSSVGSEKADIYVVPASEGGTPVKITNNGDGFLAVYPKFNAEGNMLTFVNGQLDNGGVYVSDLQGGNLIRVSENHQEGDNDAYPVFLEDATKVIYSSSKYGADNGAYELIMSTVAEAAEGNSVRMFEAAATGVVVSMCPTLAPDGASVYFIGVDIGGAQGLYKVPASGGSPTKVKTLYSSDEFLVVNLTYVKE